MPRILAVQRYARAGWGLVCGLLLVATACAPSIPQGTTNPSPGSGGAPATAASKTLRLGLQGFMEPKSGVISFGSVGGFDPLEHFMIFHSSLTVYNPQGELVPRLAEKVPSLADGDWKTFPDGTMEVSWRLKPNLTWHDGRALSADDFVFGLHVVRDPDVPAGPPSWLRRITDATAPDARTLVLRWGEPTFLAGGTGAGDVPALPRHLIGALYDAGDKSAFNNATYWTSEFVGLGPYKLSRWQLGSYMEGLAFDGYALGRPKIDRVLVTYVGDVNAIIAGVLGGELDAVPIGARFDATQLLAVQSGLGADGGTTFMNPFGVRTIWLQFRDPTTPWARDVRVRRALLHSIDRLGMSEALQYGLSTPADTFILTSDNAFPLLEQRGLARYPYDVDRARQLLAEAGWTPGGDGVLRNAAGQPFSIDLSATGQGSNVQEIETVANEWQKAGFQANPVPLPPQTANLDERKNTVRGGFLWPWTPSVTAPQNLASTQIPSERTAWKGPNYGGYSNPTYDSLFERVSTTLDPQPRRDVLASMMSFLAEELPVLPIYYYGIGVIARRNVQGPAMVPPQQTATSWDIHTWEMR